MTTAWPLTEAGPVGSVICPKCGHLNTLIAETAEVVCARCERHLFVVCHHCGELNYRGNHRCTACRTQLRVPAPLHQPPIHLFVWPVRWSWQSPRRWVLPAQLAVFVAGVLLTFLGVVKWVERKPPPPVEPVERQVYVLEDGQLRPLPSSSP